MKAHAELPQIGPAHFSQRLALFRTTAAEVCPPRAAALFAERAERMSESLQMGIALHRGVHPAWKSGELAPVVAAGGRITSLKSTVTMDR